MTFSVVLKPKAINAIVDLGYYLIINGYPLTAKTFTDELMEFAMSIGQFPNKYPACRYKSLTTLGLHCVTYKNWVFIYRIAKSKVIILNVVHGSRLE